MPKKICRVDGCENESLHKSLCCKHYTRFIRYGDVHHLARKPNGSGTLSNGYIEYRTAKGGRIKEHILKAERALGKKLPKGSHVHHINYNTTDNRNQNLVICPDMAYHKLLHMRTNALNSCKPPYFRKCPFCKGYDDPIKMAKRKSGIGTIHFAHKECVDNYNRRYRNAETHL